MSVEVIKKRELLPKLHKIITAFTNMSGDVAKLELIDNDLASKRLRVALIDVINKDIKDFQAEITNIRYDIKDGKGKTPKRPKKPTKNINDVHDNNTKID